MSWSSATLFKTLSDRADLLLRTGTVVQTRAAAGHGANLLPVGGALQLMGLPNGTFVDIYNAKEPLSAFKVRFADFVVSGAVFPETTAKAERVEFGKVVQAAVDACEVKAAPTIDEQLANLAKFAKIANDTANLGRRGVVFLRQFSDSNGVRHSLCRDFLSQRLE